MNNDIYLRKLKSSDASDNYVKWMNDTDINQFLESRFQTHSKKTIEEFINNTNNCPSEYLLGIFLKNSDKHIGNIKIGGIDSHHKFAYIGLIIGDKNEWGKGYATKAIQLATQYGIKKLEINTLISGIYSNNKASYKVFTNAGYQYCGKYKNKLLYNNKYYDEIILQYSKNQ